MADQPRTATNVNSLIQSPANRYFDMEARQWHIRKQIHLSDYHFLLRRIIKIIYCARKWDGDNILYYAISAGYSEQRALRMQKRLNKRMYRIFGNPRNHNISVDPGADTFLWGFDIYPFQKISLLKKILLNKWEAA